MLSVDRFAVLRGAAAVFALATLLLFPAVARADIELELQELIDSIDPDLGDPGTTLPPPGGEEPLPPPPGEPPPPPEGGGEKVQLIRIAPNAYWDGISMLARRPGSPAKSPREISNEVLDQPYPVASGKDASDMVWQWGQFIDHDIDLTEFQEPREHADIRVPTCDPYFDPNCDCDDDPTPQHCFIPFDRSEYDPTTGTDPLNPRQQLNSITAVVDASNIYGADSARTQALRELNPNLGKLKTSPGNFLPFNEFGLDNAIPMGADPTDFFASGDIRVNETVPLSAMHTLWMREHNTVADSILATYPWLDGNTVFDLARRIVITEMQIVTYKEFLPVILGNKAVTKYSGYHPTVDPGIANEFSTAMYRLGHTMLSSMILRLDANGYPTSYGPLALMDAFFECEPIKQCKLINEGGLEPLMKGLSEQVMQKIDSMVVDDVRNFLFGEPGQGGLDLASLNIQRGRDHGLPDYNTCRLYYGLTPVNNFSQISGDPDVQQKLYAAYEGNIDGIDPWVGALAEDPINESKILVGELLYTSLTEQFLRMRDGDPDWYQNILSTSSQRAAEKQTLAKIIARNTTLERKDLNANVFIVK
jgi:hypothetical protein